MRFEMRRGSRIHPWLLPALLAAALLFAACPEGGGPPTGGNGGGDDGGVGDAGGDDGGPPEERVFVRREVNGLDPDGPEIAALRRGVEVMQSRPADDPTSWLYQANVHGIPVAGEFSSRVCDVTPGGVREAWKTCQHGSYFFLSWHRMYLYYFERILRDASGDPDFALPFWDYEEAANRALPVVFRDPADPANPLFTPNRAPGINDGTARLDDDEVSAALALSRSPFWVPPPVPSNLSFGGLRVAAPIHNGRNFGQLELQPHNLVHNFLGGDFGWMAWPQCAARDPIFWLHHANIDRLWQVWLNEGGERRNPTDDDNWMTTEFVFFDVGGGRVVMTGAEVLNTARQLDYRYEGVPAEAAPADAGVPDLGGGPETEAEMETLASHDGAVTLGRARTSVSVDLPSATSERMRTLAAAEEGTGQPLLLILEGVELVHPGGYYKVYLNLPEGAEPDPGSDYYVGTLALFGSHEGEEHGGGGGRLAFDVTDAVRALEERGEWGGEVELTFVGAGGAAVEARPATAIPGFEEAEAPESYIRIARVRLGLQ